MSIRKNELIPVIPPEDHPYMHDVYARAGLNADSSQAEVLTAARNKWESAVDARDRGETAELLLGRRIDGQELHTLPREFSEHVLGAGHFDGLLAVTSQIAEVELG
jgi:hypothetical protein